jgi:hypothetical protein
VSAPPDIPTPLTAESDPSSLDVKPYEIFDPSAASPSNEYFSPEPSAVTVRVRLFGAWVPSYFDFARFNFHVPANEGFVCAIKVPAPTAAATSNANKLISATLILREYAPAIKNALHRGVIMRFLLFDTSDEKNCGVLAYSLNRDCNALQNLLKDSLAKLRDIRRQEPNGRLDVKLFKEVPFKSLWIKDATMPAESVVQVQFHDPDESQRPSFRIGRLDDGGFAGYLEGQFDGTWKSTSSSVVDLSK